MLCLPLYTQRSVYDRTIDRSFERLKIFIQSISLGPSLHKWKEQISSINSSFPSLLLSISVFLFLSFYSSTADCKLSRSRAYVDPITSARDKRFVPVQKIIKGTETSGK